MLFHLLEITGIESVHSPTLESSVTNRKTKETRTGDTFDLNKFVFGSLLQMIQHAESELHGWTFLEHFPTEPLWFQLERHLLTDFEPRNALPYS